MCLLEYVVHICNGLCSMNMCNGFCSMNIDVHCVNINITMFICEQYSSCNKGVIKLMRT